MDLKMVLAGAALLVLVVADPAVGAKLYKWTDDKGVVHYTDHLPPEAAAAQREVLDAQGATRSVLPRQKSEAELKAQAEREQTERLQAKTDEYLRGFPKLSDLLAARDERFAGLDKRIEESEKTVETARKASADLHVRDKIDEADGAPKDPALEAQMKTYDESVQAQTSAIRQLRENREHTAQQFERDIERYKQIKGVSEATQ